MTSQGSEEMARLEALVKDLQGQYFTASWGKAVSGRSRVCPTRWDPPAGGKPHCFAILSIYLIPKFEFKHSLTKLAPRSAGHSHPDKQVRL